MSPYIHTQPRDAKKPKPLVADFAPVDIGNAVNHPVHYGGKDNPHEAIKVIEAWGLDFCLGNTVKYIARAGKKGKGTVLEDLKKASWYLQRRIKQLGG